MPYKLNPHTLKTKREHAHLTQSELAQKVGCSPRTVSRWEQGETEVRPRLGEALAKALYTTLLALTKPLAVESEPTEPNPLLSRTRLSVGIPSHYRNALAYVCDRYSVSEDNVVGLAPLMFMLFAETSLAERRKEIAKVVAVLGDANEQLGKIAKYLQPLELFDPEFEQIIEREEKSIAALKVFEGAFGSHVSPFVKLLKAIARNVPDGIVEMIDEGPTYELAGRAMGERLNVSGEVGVPQDLEHWLRCGEIDLKDAIRRSRRGDEAGFLQWLTEQVERAQRDHDQLWDELKLPKLDIDLGGVA